MALLKGFYILEQGYDAVNEFGKIGIHFCLIFSSPCQVIISVINLEKVFKTVQFIALSLRP